MIKSTQVTWLEYREVELIERRTLICLLFYYCYSFFTWKTTLSVIYFFVVASCGYSFSAVFLHDSFLQWQHTVENLMLFFLQELKLSFILFHICLTECLEVLVVQLYRHSYDKANTFWNVFIFSTKMISRLATMFWRFFWISSKYNDCNFTVACFSEVQCTRK